MRQKVDFPEPTDRDSLKRKLPFVLNTSFAKSSQALLTLLAQERGWIEERKIPHKGLIQWLVGPEDLE
ncbi:hypothetical protein CYMTET_23370, partial [Cymbomonas tetramitiformis]